MAKALGLLVAVVIAKGLVLLRAIVPRQLEETLPVAGVLIGGDTLLAGIAQEVEVEASVGRLVSANQGHANNLLVELERPFGILDSKHGVVL